MVESTIAAISTALGEGGIAVVRISGADAVKISTEILKRKKFEIPGKLYLTSLIDDDGNIIDRVLAVNFVKPNSYTGEDIVEIHTHGGIFVARLCLELLLKHGAKIAEAGEFTRRAFINGHIDLSQAEGVLGLIKSRSIEALHASARTLTGELSRTVHKIHDDILNLQSYLEIDLDFPENENFDPDFNIISKLENLIAELDVLISKCSAGFLLNEGVKVIIMGSPNVGKSSLLNSLLEKNRAIVTDIPGTTRDIIKEQIIINGLPVNISDTAGLRETDNIIEAEGVKLALNAMNESDICLYVIDGSRELNDEELNFVKSLEDKNAIIILNKSDLEQRIKIETLISENLEKISVSAKNHTGIEKLKALIYDRAVKNSILNSGLNVSAGQLEEIRESSNAVKDAYNSVINDLGADITAAMLNSARTSLMKVLGIEAGDELLDNMFSRFCVGK